jgi:hypothetical protein
VDKALSTVSLVRWNKKGRRLLFLEADSEEGRSHDKVIREYSETFLSNEDKKLAGMNELYKDAVKGIVFGQDSKKIAVYYVRKMPFESDGKEENMAVAFIYKKETTDKYLGIDCAGCTLQEFLSDIVLPVIQY